MPFRIAKIGNIGAIYIQGNIDKTYADGETILTLAEGFIPYVNADYAVFKTDGSFAGTLRLSTNGIVAPVFGGLSSGAIRATLIYQLVV